MMSCQNFLLGRGERLTAEIALRRDGKPDRKPYSLDEARTRLAPMLTQAVSAISELPDDACPRDQAIISITMHPECVAQSCFPNKLLDHARLKVVGSHQKIVLPERTSANQETGEHVTVEYFARGARSALRAWSEGMPNRREFESYGQDARSLEGISAPAPKGKLKAIDQDAESLLMEVVLHADEIEAEERISEFRKFLRARDIEFGLGKRFCAKGLCFLELRAPPASAEQVATFTDVRVLRQMPQLRGPLKFVDMPSSKSLLFRR